MDAVKTGALIAQARKEKELTQGDLANQLHVSIQAVSKWERGLNFPDITLMEPLAELLDLTVTELMAGERNAPPQEEVVRDSLRAGLSQLGPKGKKWRVAFVCLALLLAVLGSWRGYIWVRDNTEWLPQKETVLIPREIDESAYLTHLLMGNDIVCIMDTLWADDFHGFTFQLELWKGSEMVDCQEILSASGYGEDENTLSRRNSLAFLLKLNREENSLTYSLYHAGALARSAEYKLPDIEINGWGRGRLSQPIEVDRETGTILACISMDTGSGVRSIATGNLAAPTLLEDGVAVVLRLTCK